MSKVNPYVRVKRGPVAPEMFYGRTAERNSVLDVDGTQLIFGGRRSRGSPPSCAPQRSNSRPRPTASPCIWT